jgi:hypothetical protein
MLPDQRFTSVAGGAGIGGAGGALGLLGTHIIFVIPLLIWWLICFHLELLFASKDA